MHLLQTDQEHRPVRFFKDRSPDFDRVVGPDGQEKAVECGVMKLAEREAVADDRIAFIIGIGDDVRRVEKLLMTESAYGALLAVCVEYLLTELLLVESPADCGGYVLPPYLIPVLGGAMKTWVSQVLESRRFADVHLEVETGSVVVHNVDGPRRQVAAWKSPVEVDEREFALHRQPKPAVVREFRVGPALRV